MKTEEEKRQPEGRPDADYNREEFLEKILKHRIACFESLDTPAWDHISETAQALAETGGGFIIVGVKENDGELRINYSYLATYDILKIKIKFEVDFPRLHTRLKLIKIEPERLTGVIIFEISPTGRSEKNEIYEQLSRRIKNIENPEDLKVFLDELAPEKKYVTSDTGMTIKGKLKETEEKLNEALVRERRIRCRNYGLPSLFNIYRYNEGIYLPDTLADFFIESATSNRCACFNEVLSWECIETICKMACSFANNHGGHIYYGIYQEHIPSEETTPQIHHFFAEHIAQFIGGLLKDERLLIPPLNPEVEIISIKESKNIIHFAIKNDGKYHEYRCESEWKCIFVLKDITLPSLEEVQKKIDDEKTEIIPVDLTPANTPVEKPATDSSTDAPEQEGSFDYDKLKKEVKDNDNFKKALEFLSSEKGESVFIHEKKTYTFNVDWITGEGFQNAVNKSLKTEGIKKLIETYNKDKKDGEKTQYPQEINKMRKNSDLLAAPLKFAIWLGVFAWVGDQHTSGSADKNNSTPRISINDILKKKSENKPENKSKEDHYKNVAENLLKTFFRQPEQTGKYLKNNSFDNNYTRPIALYIYHWLDAGIPPEQAENN